MEKNTKVILIFFLAIVILVLVMYFSVTNPNDNKEEIVNISTGFFPALGSGEIKIIEFSDFACPVCKLQEPILKQVSEEYGDKISFYYRNFPLPSHKNSFDAALASSCANEQEKFWEYHDLLFGNQGNFEKELLERIASQLGLNTQEFNECLDSE